MLILFLGGLFTLIAINVPIGFALIGTCILLMLNMSGFAPQTITQGVYRGIDNFPLLAIPFFIYAGEVMNVGGISRRIVNFADAVLGHIAGGIGYVGILSSMIFAGVSGSAVADTAAMGSILLPVMKKNGYDVPKSTALIAASGCIGPIIPPSIPMILYAVYSEVSVAELFLGGIIPGVLVGGALMVAWFLHSRKMGYPKRQRTPLKELFQKTLDAFWAILLPFIIIGGIIAGIVTPTESAVIAVVYALIVSLFVYREMKISDIPAVLVNGSKIAATTMFVVGGAVATGYYITIARIPELLTHLILSFTTNIYVILLLINILLLLVGCVLSVGSAILILTPVLVPIILSFNLDPVYFGVIMVVNLCLGLMTPPVGAVMYIGCSLSDISMVQFVRAVWPFLLVMAAVLILITYTPGLVMFIPGLL